MRDGPEEQVRRDVKSYCKAKGWFVWDINSEAQYSAVKKCWAKSKAAPEGCPDILGVDLYGRMIAFELKAPTNYYIRLSQRMFLEQLISQGAMAGVVRNCGDVFALEKMNREQLLATLLEEKVKPVLLATRRKIGKRK